MPKYKYDDISSLAMTNLRQKHLWLLASFLLTFGTIFLLAYLHLQKGTSLFPIGMHAPAENIIIMGFSVLCILRTVYEIIRHP